VALDVLDALEGEAPDVLDALGGEVLDVLFFLENIQQDWCVFAERQTEGYMYNR
jgi:hypothetical protein